MKKYHIETYGCQANEHDSEIMAGILQEMGYENAKKAEEADIVLFNTCCVREKAENKVLSGVGELKSLRTKRPGVIIGIAGCMTQQNNMPRHILHRAPHVNLIFGTHNIQDLPRLINNILEKKETPQVKVLPDSQEITEGLPTCRQFPYKALVHITYGCNNYCSYCIVPYVRGREKSREPQNILQEISFLAKDGVKEIMLLGQNVNSYGKDLKTPFDFADLLEKVHEIEGIERIRYMTSHPRDFSDKLIDSIKILPRVCRHFHLPVQSGSDKILKLMNRGYTRGYYLNLIDKIKHNFPQASITTDIIVGFPGEEENDFAQTLSLVEEVGFDSAFTFKYSPRSGTPAARITEQVDEAIKKDRLQILMDVQNRISLNNNLLLEGKNMSVLVEGPSKTSGQIFSGRTDTNKTVLFEGRQELIGDLITVRIQKAQTWILKGEVI